MTNLQYLERALDFIVEQEEDNDYICEKLHEIPEMLEVCMENCKNLCRDCVLRFLKHCRKD